jgi:hypothetical integral membrane protein (TIGR02206 family)
MRSDALFQPFGPDHLVVLGLTLAIAAMFGAARSHFAGSTDRWSRTVIASVLFAAAAWGWLAAWKQGGPLVPLQLCDLALLAAVWALLTLQRWACLVVYFWGIAGSLQALLTPDLATPFPGFWWFQFFWLHAGTVLAALYLAVTGRVRATLRSTTWVWGATNAYGAILLVVNRLYGTNFGYLSEKPAQPSLLDYLGPWPWYLLGMEAIGTLSLLMLYAPFAIARRLRR